MRTTTLAATVGLSLALGLAPGAQPVWAVAEEEDPAAAKARAFLGDYQKELARLDTAAAGTSWRASTSGRQEDFDASAKAQLALRTFHSDPEKYRKVLEYLRHPEWFSPVDFRALEVARLAFEGNQLPPELLAAIVELSTDIMKTFKTHRATIDGRRVSDNDLLEMMREETDSAKRREIWAATKQVGAAVGPKLVKLAKLRNQAARHVGYRNYWDMMIHLQEHNPEQLLAIFDELDRLTAEPFAKMKKALDAERAARFGIKPDEMMPWHYDNPFFQAAPPSAQVDVDEFYRDKPKEAIVEMARVFYAGIDLPIDDIIQRSDLYEREGKDQHAFCSDIDRAGDVRTLLNIKPTAEWMDTMLHEQGHAVYDKYLDRSLPYNLRTAAHIFTTEGVAMFMGALAKDPAWLVEFAGADPQRVEEVADALRQQRRREQLIFARWTLLMLHFERALYENPDQDLNTLWWDLAEKYQLLRRPPERNEPDWASKTHFAVAPVYYHNYQLGELFAAQLRAALAKELGHDGPPSSLRLSGRKDVGEFFKREVFAPGSRLPWPEFVRHVTGEPLGAKHFAEEVK